MNSHWHEKKYIVFVLAVLSTAVFLSFSSLALARIAETGFSAFAVSGSSDCGRWNANTVSSSAFYTGYGVPWSVLLPGAPLVMHSNCVGDGIALSVGNGGEQVYVWGDAYISKDGGPWQRISLSGGQQSGKWFLGNASVSIPPSAVSSSGTNYLLAYVCSFQNGSWHCGCRDKNSCDESGGWQLQEVRNPASHNGTSAETMFNTPTLFYPTNYIVSRGSGVVVNGGGLSGENSVFLAGFGSVPANATGDGSSISFTVPNNIPYGYYTITAHGQSGKSNGTFIVVQDPNAASPIIVGINELAVHPGDHIVLYGKNFDTTKNQIRTNFGIVSGVASPDGKILSFIFPEVQTTLANVPDALREMLEEKGVTPELLRKARAAGAGGFHSQMEGTITVVNKGGISGRKSITVVQ